MQLKSKATEEYLETWTEFDDLKANITRYHFEFVDREILQALPLKMLLDLQLKVECEVKRRQDARTNTKD